LAQDLNLLATVLQYIGVGTIAVLLFRIGTWWIERKPIPVPSLKCELLKNNGQTLCEIMMNVTNKGRRHLRMFKAGFAILKGKAVSEDFVGEPVVRKLLLPDFVDASPEDLDEFTQDGSLIWKEPLPQMTAEGVSVAPEEELSEVRAYYFDQRGIYQVVFEIVVKRSRLSRGSPYLVYHKTCLLVVK